MSVESARTLPAAGTILPDPRQLRLLRLTTEQGSTAVVETTAPVVACPVCGQYADRVHSRYTRVVADIPWHGVSFRLSPFEPYLRERWNAGEQNGQQLLREIRARGYQGSSSNLYSLLAQWRVGPRHCGPYARQAVPAPAPAPALQRSPHGLLAPAA